MAFLSNHARRRRNQSSSPIVVSALLAILVILSIVLFLNNFVWSSGSHQAKEVVKQFYQFEQAGDYGSAWELLHEQMKVKYSKEQYIQLRASIFMQQLGAKTFQFELRDSDQLDAWSMDETSVVLHHVYKIGVSQQLLTIFGAFTLEQEVYATKENDEWKVLWSFRS